VTLSTPWTPSTHAAPSTARSDSPPTLWTVPELVLHPIPVDQTRVLRKAILRPRYTVEELAANEPAGAFAVGVFAGQELVAVGLVGREGEPGDWRVRGMATAPGARRRGAGTAVLNALLRHARAHGARRVWCNARIPARSLYERAGFRPGSDEFEQPETGPHVVMELVIDGAPDRPTCRRASPA
jgi:GNAT superfamily N-acetyltransferase